ncbi:hypothetical protein L211DRAFT_828647 [Terfezia boudieri ATCC MYA-4762]|uniref:Alpha-glucosidase n=1 Tax=Terfezia boudieri ATCC MYA-4762 TaxID=1051890 RepID=A0A3N4LDP4_9PEZI|nr:hypothetical protein L211DRAFT_828647 [Terfezia boudieri ATCC MYA-4762]
MGRQTDIEFQSPLRSFAFLYFTRSTILIITAVCLIGGYTAILCSHWSQERCYFQYTSAGRQSTETTPNRHLKTYYDDSSTSGSWNDLDKCPGYHVTSIDDRLPGRLIMDLFLHHSPCNVYGKDVQQLKLDVTYESRSMVRLKFTDPHNERYEVPHEIIHGPVKGPVAPEPPLLRFNFTTSPDPFKFQILRRSTGEVIFDTGDYPLIFEQQYIRLKTMLPPNANIYGLGEHSGTFRFNTSENIIRTLWARDSPGIPYPSNLYGSHPIYLEYREASQMAHGVFLKNSNGMDVKIRNEGSHTTLEYNVIGGVLDLFFFAGDGGPTLEGDPKAVAREYSEVIGTPTMAPYWYLGFHQCRWGYRDWFEVAEVVANYSQADIPLETMWTDIDYLSHRHIFTLDPDNFPKKRMQQVVDWLHNRGQKYVVNVDPAVAYNRTIDGHDYGTFIRGETAGIFMMRNDSVIYKGVVWPGVVAYPDWFHENATAYWTKEFEIFFNMTTGIDVDAVWIDMNEPSNFCPYPCDPDRLAKELGLPPPSPPKREPPRRIPGFPGSDMFQISPRQHIDDELHRRWRRKYAPQLTALRSTGGFQRQTSSKEGIRNVDFDIKPERKSLLDPLYQIHNDFPDGLSHKTVPTDIRHRNGYYEYDVHNLFGTTMGYASYAAMLKRRPNERPVVVGRSTFPGAQRKMFHWLGDNWSTWEQYRGQIAYMLGFSAIYQMPMVGSDICGFIGDATPRLCARWATLGAFNPFMRNHNWIESEIGQEFYRWPLVAKAARNAIDIRYRLLDYFYTALWRQSRDGTPAVLPLWMVIGKGVDHITLSLEYQFMYGEALMVAPVVEEDGTDVSIYFPTGTKEERVRWFDFVTLEEITPIKTPPAESGHLGFSKKYSNIGFTEIPLFWKSGNVIPLRSNSANITSELRKQNFELLVVPDANGDASGALYLDDGLSIAQAQGAVFTMLYLHQKEEKNRAVFTARKVANGSSKGSISEEYSKKPEYLNVAVKTFTILGVERIPKSVEIKARGQEDEEMHLAWIAMTEKVDWEYDRQRRVLVIKTGGDLGVTEEFKVSVSY